ncbi:MAG: hypothetical protein ACI9N3_002094, partial [Colwellia sp.]
DKPPSPLPPQPLSVINKIQKPKRLSCAMQVSLKF